MNQRHWETSMGMRGYRGSPAEREDRAAGLVVGGRCQWKAQGDPVATIKRIEIDSDGDPRFHLTFDDDHKDVTAFREEIAPQSSSKEQSK